MKFNLRLAALVFAGGALGSALRYWVGLQIEDDLWFLFAVNVAGTFALGLSQGNKNAPNWVIALFGTGFAGGFTTMSGVSLVLASAHFYALPMLYAYCLAMFVVAVGAYWLGQSIIGGAKR